MQLSASVPRMLRPQANSVKLPRASKHVHTYRAADSRVSFDSEIYNGHTYICVADEWKDFCSALSPPPG